MKRATVISLAPEAKASQKGTQAQPQLEKGDAAATSAPTTSTKNGTGTAAHAAAASSTDAASASGAKSSPTSGLPAAHQITLESCAQDDPDVQESDLLWLKATVHKAKPMLTVAMPAAESEWKPFLSTRCKDLGKLCNEAVVDLWVNF